MGGWSVHLPEVDSWFPTWLQLFGPGVNTRPKLCKSQSPWRTWNWDQKWASVQMARLGSPWEQWDGCLILGGKECSQSWLVEAEEWDGLTERRWDMVWVFSQKTSSQGRPSLDLLPSKGPSDTPALHSVKTGFTKADFSYLHSWKLIPLDLPWRSSPSYSDSWGPQPACLGPLTWNLNHYFWTLCFKLVTIQHSCAKRSSRWGR